jgi:hypothetical protein
MVIGLGDIRRLVVTAKIHKSFETVEKISFLFLLFPPARALYTSCSLLLYLPLAMLAKSRNLVNLFPREHSNLMDLWISAAGGEAFFPPARYASEIQKSRNKWIYGLPPQAGRPDFNRF